MNQAEKYIISFLDSGKLVLIEDNKKILFSQIERYFINSDGSIDFMGGDFIGRFSLNDFSHYKLEEFEGSLFLIIF